MIFDWLENKKKKILLKYSFVNAFLSEVINEEQFIENLIKFQKELIFKGFTKSEINSLIAGAEDNKRERKNKIRRENILKKIIISFTNLLKERFKEESENFIFTYEMITMRWDSIFKRFRTVNISRMPAYGIFLVMKQKANEKYEIMHLFKQDLDSRNYIKFNFNQIPAFAENIE